MQTLVNSARLSGPSVVVRSQRIIALGDSTIYGYGDPVGGGWVERLRRGWMEPGGADHAVYNLGIRGDGVYQVVQRLEQEFRLRGELRNRVPDLILLSVGVNDSARLGRPTGRNYTEFEAFQVAMADLLERATSLGPVLFIGMGPVNEAQMPFLDCFYYTHADQFRYKEATKSLCQSMGVPYLEIFDRWLDQGEAWYQSRLCADGLHPNVLGYESLLNAIVQWPVFVEKVGALR